MRSRLFRAIVVAGAAMPVGAPLTLGSVVLPVAACGDVTNIFNPDISGPPRDLVSKVHDAQWWPDIGVPLDATQLPPPDLAIADGSSDDGGPDR